MGNVEVVELGVVRSSTWDTELRKIEQTQAARTSAGQPYVVLGSTQGADGFLGAVRRAGHTPTNLPTDFLDSLSKDLNGSFGYRNTPLGDGVSDMVSK
ncbi:hypothetical protein AA0121_g13296 [Alternaria tenuissima]|nr:hypothetical protein AA0121_g13296 [Alternaria tenuissima]